tara:strand:- start:226 stop:786 length:561 start_codon:yes stop_codon:yes gene_type:complete
MTEFKQVGDILFAMGQQLYTARQSELASFSAEQADNKSSYDGLVSSGSTEINDVNSSRQVSHEGGTAGQNEAYQNRIDAIETIIADDKTYSFAEASDLLKLEKANLAEAITAATEEENSNYQAAKDAFGFDKIEDAEAILATALEGVEVIPVFVPGEGAKEELIVEGFEFPEGEEPMPEAKVGGEG